jgi:hypothetical protein
MWDKEKLSRWSLCLNLLKKLSVLIVCHEVILNWAVIQGLVVNYAESWATWAGVVGFVAESVWWAYIWHLPALRGNVGELNSISAWLIHFMCETIQIRWASITRRLTLIPGG